VADYYTTLTPDEYQTKRVKITLYTNGNTTQVVTKVPSTPSKWTNYAEKGRNPDWRRDIRENKQAATHLYGERKYYALTEPSACEVMYETPSSIMGFQYAGPRSMPVATTTGYLPLSEADSRAKTYFLNKLIAHRRSLQGGVVLGELRETLTMLRNPAKALRRGMGSWLDDAKKRYRRQTRIRRNLRNFHRSLRESWLEQAFGWQPLVNDIDDAGRAINKMDYYDLGREVLFGYAEEESLAQLLTGRSQDSGIYIDSRTQQKRAVSVRYMGATKATVMNPVRFATRLFGFTLADFVPTIWELIPYSFLVDYFTNIGDILNGWSYGRSDLAWSVKTTRRIYSCELTWNYVPKTAQYYLTFNYPGVFTHTRNIVERDPYEGSFMPSMSWSLPGFGTRWINMAALVRGRRFVRR